MSYAAFHFIEGTSPGGKTHVYAWNGSEWVIPCETLPEPRIATLTKPFCKLCDRLTSSIHPYPAKR